MFRYFCFQITQAVMYDYIRGVVDRLTPAEAVIEAELSKARGDLAALG